MAFIFRYTVVSAHSLYSTSFIIFYISILSNLFWCLDVMSDELIKIARRFYFTYSCIYYIRKTRIRSLKCFKDSFKWIATLDTSLTNPLIYGFYFEIIFLTRKQAILACMLRMRQTKIICKLVAFNEIRIWRDWHRN